MTAPTRSFLNDLRVEIILPLLTVALAACVIAFGASAFLRLLGPVVDALR